MRRILALLTLAGLMGVLTGCESGSSGEAEAITFKNQSTYNVTVTPNGQNEWQAFLLSPGQDRTVDIGTTVFYIYAPTALVQDTSSEGGSVVTFTDI